MEEKTPHEWLNTSTPGIAEGLEHLDDNIQWKTGDENTPLWVTTLYAARERAYKTIDQIPTQTAFEIHNIDRDESFDSQIEITTRNIRELARRIIQKSDQMYEAIDIICLRVSELIDENHKCIFRYNLDAQELKRIQETQYYLPLMMKELIAHFEGIKNVTTALGFSSSTIYKAKNSNDKTIGNYSRPEKKFGVTKILLQYFKTYKKLHHVPTNIELPSPTKLVS